MEQQMRVLISMIDVFAILLKEPVCITSFPMTKP